MFLFYNIAPFKFFYGESHFHFLTVFENFHPLFYLFGFPIRLTCLLLELISARSTYLNAKLLPIN